MRTETVLKVEAMDLLIKTLGILETERFIKSNNFDYTEWHKELWKDKTIDEIHKMAVDFEKKKYNEL
jgi:hypothetical protein